ncbi:MAG: ribonuclease P protein subunit [Methanocalculaceae archaeon]|jgi:ribonuclease P protein subunit POP4|nr:ribonuclease P protein subunit [Methanocalculaceae archaeon]
MITPQSILQHELIGLYAVVVRSRNKTQEGMCGFIIDETKNTLSLRSGGVIKCLEKQYMLLRVTLPDSVDVVIDCSSLSVYPARRIKTRA